MKCSLIWRARALVIIAAAFLTAGIVQKSLAAEPAPAATVDLNTATAAQLEEISGVGAAYAKKIIAGRPYKSVDDLKKAGLPARIVAKITPLVSVAAAATAPSKTAATTKSGTAGATTDAKTALVDLNTATKAELKELPGIAEANAKKIIAARPYKSVDELAKIGLPAATVTKITPLVTVGQPKSPHKVAKPVVSDSASGLVDLNTATKTELEGLPGIGPANSKKIIAGRPYKSVADLSKSGIPASTVAKITPMVTVAAASADANPTTPSTEAPEKGMVWVNLDSKVYHKEGSRWYGKTKSGKYMSEADAIKDGYRAAKEKE